MKRRIRYLRLDPDVKLLGGETMLDIDLDLIDAQREVVRKIAESETVLPEVREALDGVNNLLEAISDHGMPVSRTKVEYADDYLCPECQSVYRKHQLRMRKKFAKNAPSMEMHLLCPLCGHDYGVNP